jgi:hypothetical protein
MIARRQDNLVAFGEGATQGRRRPQPAAGVIVERVDQVVKSKRSKPSSGAARDSAAIVAVIGSLAAGASQLDVPEPLGVRVPHAINVRLAKLEYELLTRNIRAKKNALVEMVLSELPEQVDAGFVEKVLAFQKRKPPRRPGPRQGTA